MPDMTGENSTADLSRDLVCLVPQIMLQLPLPVSFCVPGIAHNSGSPGGQGSVVASRAVPPCNVKGWAPHHQGYSIRVQLVTSQGISALWKRLNSEVSFNFKNPLISLLLDSVHSLSCVRLFATPWPAACQASLSITNSRSLLKLMSIESVMPSNHLILCHPLLLLLPSIFPSIRVVSSESALCIRWPKYWSFSLSISPSNEYSGLIFFRIDWLDLLAVQGTLKSLLQHRSSKASIL